MTTETILIVVGSIVVPLMLALLTNIRQSLSNFGGRLGALERDVAVLSAIVDRQHDRERVRRPTRAPEVPPPDDDDAE